jgi:glycosidase
MENWLKQAIIYQLLIDRFAGVINASNSNNFLGGNINGIIEKLDYLSNLGINAIWLSPFFETKEYHGYHITNFEKIDPHFGDINDLKELIQIAHSKNIKIIADFVPNHCSCYHPFFLDAQSFKKSKYYDWFYFKKWPNDYLCFLNFKMLPKLNLDNNEVGTYIINNAKLWLSYGIDALRLDHAIGPSHQFWQKFNRAIKKDYPDVLLIGEVWGKGIKNSDFDTLNFKNKFWRKLFGINQESLQKEYYNELDGVLDYSLNEILVNAAKNRTNIETDYHFNTQIKKHFIKYPEDYYLISFLDNHDIDRFLHHCNGDIDQFKRYLKFIFSLNKPIVIYYGTETGTYNKESLTINKPYADLAVREPFNWNEINADIYNYLKELCSYRKSN